MRNDERFKYGRDIGVKIAGSVHLHCTRMRFAKPKLVLPIGSDRQIKFLFGLSIADIFIGWMYAPKITNG